LQTRTEPFFSMGPIDKAVRTWSCLPSILMPRWSISWLY